MTFFIQNILRLNKYYYKLRQNKYVLYISDFDIFYGNVVLSFFSFVESQISIDIIIFPNIYFLQCWEQRWRKLIYLWWPTYIVSPLWSVYGPPPTQTKDHNPDISTSMSASHPRRQLLQLMFDKTRHPLCGLMVTLSYWYSTSEHAARRDIIQYAANFY